MSDQPGGQSRRLTALDGLQKEGKGTRTDPSALRLHIRDNFPSVLAARARGVSWQQITEVMAAAGVRASDGSDLTWRKVATLFHTERYERNPKPKRRAARKRSTPAAAAVPSSPPPPPEPSPEHPPTAAVPFSTGDAALDRALNSVRKLTPLPPMGTMDTQGRRSPKPRKEQDDGENG